MGRWRQFRGFSAWALQIAHNRHRYIVHCGKDHPKHYILTAFYHPGGQLEQDIHLWCHDFQEETDKVRHRCWFLHQWKECYRWTYFGGWFEWRCDHYFRLLGKSTVPEDRYLPYLQKTLPWEKGRPCLHLRRDTWQTDMQGLYFNQLG